MHWSEAESQARFAAYVEALCGVMGHADRALPLRDYCTGLLLPAERKSVEPMAALIAPSRVSAEHQSLLHFVGQAPWSDEAVLGKVRELVLPAIMEHGPIESWIVDDTGFSKKGVHSVGVARQYCGRLGKTDNCQVAVTLSIANHAASLPIAYRLYLPEEWAKDAARRRKARVPQSVEFQSKPEIALDQIRAALAAGVPRGVVLADPAYGYKAEFRAGLTALGLSYAVGVQSNMSVWSPGVEPLPAKEWCGHGKRPSLLRRDKDHRPVTTKQLAMGLPQSAWTKVIWREGSNTPLASRFAALRLRPASRDWKRSTPHPFEWLLIEWPEGQAEPAKYWLSTLPEDTPLASSTQPNRAGMSNAITRSSNRNSASPITKAGAGSASTTTQRCASLPMGSWSASERRFPPQPPGAAKRLSFPTVQDPAAPPIRPERHVPNSIATLRRRLAIALASTLARCPCCQSPYPKTPHHKRL